MLSIIFIFGIYLSINSVISISNNHNETSNQLSINIDYKANYTIALLYSVITRYPYFITFRSFGNEALKYGLFLPTNKSENSIDIFYQYNTTDLFYLFILCFHFILPSNDVDVQCKDLRVSKEDHLKPDASEDFLPSYNPLFVPMMYALSVLMLLPVIIQHHRRKKNKLLERQERLRRLSVKMLEAHRSSQQISAQKILSQITKNGNFDYESIPMNTELISIPSTKTLSYDIDENDLSEPSGVNAHDCIAHLLDNTPWNSPDIYEPLTTSSSHHTVVLDSVIAIKEQYIPNTISFHNGNKDESETTRMNMINPVFFESDV